MPDTAENLRIKVEVNGEIYFPQGPEGLLDLIEEKMGPDTREAALELLTEYECFGACKHIAVLHREYGKTIRSALNELRAGNRHTAIKLLEDAL